jgi:hypothetical protein
MKHIEQLGMMRKFTCTCNGDGCDNYSLFDGLVTCIVQVLTINNLGLDLQSLMPTFSYNYKRNKNNRLVVSLFIYLIIVHVAGSISMILTTCNLHGGMLLTPLKMQKEPCINS